MPNGWRTIKSLVHKIRLHGRRGKGMAESFSRETLRHAPQKEGGWKILCDLPPVWPRLVRPLMSRMNGKKTHTHTHTPWENQREWHRMTRMTRPDCAVMCNLINTHTHTHFPPLTGGCSEGADTLFPIETIRTICHSCCTWRPWPWYVYAGQENIRAISEKLQWEHNKQINKKTKTKTAKKQRKNPPAPRAQEKYI